jgi:DNA-binding response OmpR family regulator
MRILLFEDHGRLAASIAKGLARFGFGVDTFPTASDGLSAIDSVTYEAVVLDLGLPDRDGLDVLGELRQGHSALPILILTARDDVEDRVNGLDSGADDYLTKPFAMAELAARLRAILRRPGRALSAVLSTGHLRLDVSTRQITVNEALVRFSAREIEALEMLLRREGQVVPRASFEDCLYGLSKHVSPNSIEVLISRLRRRLSAADAGCSIHTLHGIGYLLRDDTV